MRHGYRANLVEALKSAERDACDAITLVENGRHSIALETVKMLRRNALAASDAMHAFMAAQYRNAGD